MKNPFEFAKQFYRYIQGELPEGEREAIEANVKASPELQELAEEVQDKEKVRKELELILAFDEEKAWEKFRIPQRAKSRRRIVWWSSAAAVAIALGGLWLRQLSEEQSSPMTVARLEAGTATVLLETASGERYALDTLSSLRLQQADVVVKNKKGVLQWKAGGDTSGIAEPGLNKITVPNAATYSLILPDSSRVYLNSGTTLEFPSRFTGNERLIRIQGEAYCEVARNEQQPFVVETGRMRVKVLGTVFNVQAYPEETTIYTTLVSGSVAIQLDGQTARRLSPGEMACYSPLAGTLRVESTDVEEQTAWKDGLFYFKQLPLEQILRRVSRWYDLEVFYANPEVRTQIFNGKMPMYASVEDVLRKLEYAGEVRFGLKGRTLTVYRK